MHIEYDPTKDEANQRKHGVSLADAGSIDWSTALIRRDDRREYTEQRFQAFGFIQNQAKRRRINVGKIQKMSDLIHFQFSHT